MAGLYIHIPFCRKACHYCDFHFSTQTQNTDAMVDAMCLEAEYWSTVWQGTAFKTMYWGGGTPSVLTHEQRNRLLEKLHACFNLKDVTEFTMEVNPEDVTAVDVAGWKASGVNRLSMGLQCFQDDLLQWMNRSHTSKQGVDAVIKSYDGGIENITVDLIYGIPGLSDENWVSNIEKVVALPINHVSCYGLTVEDKTALNHMVQHQQVVMPGDETYNKQFDVLVNRFENEGFEWYEISNLAKEGAHSQHNSAYWQGKPYLGIGPSAHSFLVDERWYNIKSNPLYINNLKSSQPFFTKEKLSPTDIFNERVMTGLRTKWGVSVDVWGKDSNNPINILQIAEIEKLNNEELIYLDGSNVKLTTKGRHLADGVAARLFR